MTFIKPPKIEVGYQQYNNPLPQAYVTFIDEKGKFRKEKSWNNWRSQTIPPNTFDNTPTSGFTVLGSAGNTRFSERQAYVTVRDPRGFIIELKLDVFLNILATDGCNKNQIDGDYVYAWHGAELHLISTKNPQYNDIIQESDSLYNPKKTPRKPPVKRPKLETGHIYQSDDNQTLFIYMGKHTVYSELGVAQKAKKHVIVYLSAIDTINPYVRPKHAARIDFNSAFTPVKANPTIMTEAVNIMSNYYTVKKEHHFVEITDINKLINHVLETLKAQPMTASYTQCTFTFFVKNQTSINQSAYIAYMDSNYMTYMRHTNEPPMRTFYFLESVSTYLKTCGQTFYALVPIDKNDISDGFFDYESFLKY